MRECRYVCTEAGGGIALCNDAPYERIIPCKSAAAATTLVRLSTQTDGTDQSLFRKFTGSAVADIAEELSRNCYGNGNTGGMQKPSSQVFSLDANYNVVVGGSC